MTPAREFRVGALSFRFEAGTGLVRGIRWHGCEALRGIYAAVRDAHWGTLQATTAEPAVQVSPDCVRLALEGRVVAGDVDVPWRVDVVAEASGRLGYTWRAQPRRALRTNRTGLCVLHAASAAGAPCLVEHTDGRTVAGWFPTTIAPHQPFTDVRAITHGFADGAAATVRLEGEVFETEDQRNWTDDSFKTYCRPLAWPRPYEIPAGNVVVHTATLVVAGTPRASDAAAPDRPAAPAALPRIGFGLAAPLPPALRARARALRPAHVRVSVNPDTLVAVLAWAVPEAAALGCALELAVRGATVAALPVAALPAGSTVLLFDAAGTAAAPGVVAAWRAAGHAAVGTGSDVYFTELNRHRPPPDGAHTLVTFGLDAQVHAFDDTSLRETLAQHAAVVRHARKIGGHRPVAVGPIVLGPGPEAADPRLHTEFAAAWTRDSLAEIARAGAAQVTYFRLHGRGGILRDGAPTPLETLFLELAASLSA